MVWSLIFTQQLLITETVVIFILILINKTWTKEFDDLSTYVTEWNLQSNKSALDKTKDYSLKQAHELIKMVEAMTENDVDVAHIWAVQHSSAANLSAA